MIESDTLATLAQLNIKPTEMPTDCISRTDRTLAHAVIHCGDFSVKLMWSNQHWYPVLYHMDKLRMSFEPETDISIALRKAELIAVAAAVSGAANVLARTINSMPIWARLPAWQAFAQANPVSAETQSAL